MVVDLSTRWCSQIILPWVFHLNLKPWQTNSLVQSRWHGDLAFIIKKLASWNTIYFMFYCVSKSYTFFPLVGMEDYWADPLGGCEKLTTLKGACISCCLLIGCFFAVAGGGATHFYLSLQPQMGHSESWELLYSITVNPLTDRFLNEARRLWNLKVNECCKTWKEDLGRRKNWEQSSCQWQTWVGQAGERRGNYGVMITTLS